MILDRRPRRQVPSLNTAALPDLIFTVLFFFMVVTHMRSSTPKVSYTQPQGTELTRLVKKSAVTYVYIGRPEKGSMASSEGMVVQVNDRCVSIDDLADCLAAERQRMPAEDRSRMVVSVKADRKTPMDVINRVKLALRTAGVRRISYSATELNDTKN